HTFCKLCINQSITSTKSICPIDRSPLSDTKNQLKPASKLIVNMVNELLVYCPNRELGCSHVGERQLIHSHIKDDCMYLEIQCCLEECKEIFLRKDLSKHIEKCLPKIVDDCELCNLKKKSFSSKDLQISSENFICQDCHSAFSQSQFSQHIKQCPVKVVSCLHSQFGCKWSGQQHDLLNNHIKICVYESLKDFFTIYKQHSDTINQENQQLKSKLNQLNSSVDILQNQFVTISNQLSSILYRYELYIENPINTNISPIIIGNNNGDSNDINNNIGNSNNSNIIINHEDHSTLLSTHELLLSDNDRINNEIQLLNENLIDLEFKQNDALMKETLKIQQEVTSLKSTCNSLKMQINYLLMERRTTGTGVSAGENPSKLSQSIHNANNSSSSVQMSQENGSYIKSNHSNMKQLSRKIGSLYTEFPRHEKL
ncbi:12749_t:CDS:2, partial [Entrophospora sp. SA101]